jgi:hypothetical protein
MTPFSVVIALPVLLATQEMVRPDTFRARTVTATVGIGNAMGWLGGQAERYLAQERLSVFLGLGYTPADNPGDPSGLTFAGGFRSFTAGRKHRGFLELSVSQIFVQHLAFQEGDRLYGPGAQAGYQFVSRGGFGAMISFGVGYAPGVRTGESKFGALANLGLGYTWRRKQRS